MGLWATIKGEVTIHQDKHFSLRDHILTSFDEVSAPFIHHRRDNEYFVYRINFSDSIDGMNAVKKIQKFIDGIPGKVDIDTNIRWVNNPALKDGA